MNLRAKLFLAWGVLTLLLWAGVFWVVHGTVASSFDRSARQSFTRTKGALDSLQKEHGQRMRQAGVLVIQIPELRALIAEHRYELQANNSDSLEERLDHLADVAGVDFVCAVDAQAMLIGRSARAPWTGPADFHGFASQFEPAGDLLRVVFGVAEQDDQGPPRHGAQGLWTHRGRLWQVVAVPLIFQEDSDGHPGAIDGALLIGSPLTDQLARDLGASQSCEVSFVADAAVSASSLPVTQRAGLNDAIRAHGRGVTDPIVTGIGNEQYLTLYEPLADPCSGMHVGAIVIQRSLADSKHLLSNLVEKMLVIVGCGLVLAGVGSFFLSTAVTRPIDQILHAVRRVTAGDLQQALPEKRRDELGQLAAAFNEMARQLHHRRELEHRVVQVETATRTKSEFLATMSHEIRTPMTAILGYTDLLRSPEALPDDRLTYINIIRRNGDHLLSIINDILDLSKIESGQMEIERIPCSPGAVLSDVLSLMRVRASEKGLGLEVRFDSPIPRTIHSDPTRLRQILINLVGNAIKFTESGCVRIVAGMVQGDDDHPPRLQFQVIDSGIGMTQEQARRIFEPFSQADTSTTRRFGGTGLGLSICQRLTAMLGGRITLDSTPKLGSIFTFTIDPGPVDGVAMIDHFDEAVTHDAAACAVARPGRLHGRVLLAEDGKDNRQLLSLYLRSAGAAVTEAEDGRVACDKALAADPPFDLILMDMQMPEMDGYAATRHLRQTGYAGPIIALTANAMPTDQARCRSCGCTDYLTKPIARELLLEHVGQYLKASGARGPDEHARQGRLSGPAAAPGEASKGPSGGTSGGVGNGAEPLDASVQALLDSYVVSLPEKVRQLHALLEQRNQKDLAKLLHALRGSGGLFGFMTITDHAQAAEAAIGEDQAFTLVEQKVLALVEQMRAVNGYDPAREAA